jgi:hypothetical protein
MVLKFAAATLLCSIALCAAAQQKKTPPAPASPSTQVLFSRSDSQTSSQKPAGPGAPATARDNVTDTVTNAERSVVSFISYRLDVHLAPRDHSINALAHLQIRNTGSAPLTVLPLQLSSSLNFDSVSRDGKSLPFAQHTLNSDTDHTGQLHEAVIQLPTPLAPGEAFTLQVAYSGTIELASKRLQALGSPESPADHSDWDRISEDFTGLRGFGNVVWYPVASVPALLGDGDKVFSEIGAQKLRQSAATVAINLTLEYFLAPPTVIALDGHSIPVPKPSVTPTLNYPGVLTCSLPPTRLGFAAPSLFLGYGTVSSSNGVRVYAGSEDQTGAQALLNAASTVQPLVVQWLGAASKSPVTVIGLPESQDLTWEQGTLLLTSLGDQSPGGYSEMMSRAMAHARFQSPRAWLNEGVPTFIQTLWIEQASTRTRALESLEPQRRALALAEPATPGDSAGEPLINASDPIYYRTKATFVLWMLREILGDQQLGSALQAYNPDDDTEQTYFQQLVERAADPGPDKNLKWFFDNWVYNDRGLPDLSIAHVHSSPASSPGLYLTAVDIMNSGSAEAKVPVTVRSAENTLTEHVLLPAHTRTVYRMLVQGLPDQVIVNNGAVPEISADIHQLSINNQ